MPRAARIDIPGILQHVIVRGIEKRKIFLDDQDRLSFLDRLSKLLLETRTDCLAWALLDNHAHLLLRPLQEKLARFMRRLLTGHATTFNLRHNRAGHLFQNRYKSIVCEEEPYLLQLVRYIHLNPLRAGAVGSLDDLDSYTWSGHAVLMGRRELQGQATDEILSRFGRGIKETRSRYRSFVEDGISQGRRDEFAGGGMRRSRVLAEAGEAEEAFDARVLGSGAFVEQLRESEALERPAAMMPLDELTRKVAEAFGVEVEALRLRKRNRQLTDARSVFCYIAVREMGYNGVEVGKGLKISRAGVSAAASRGEALVQGAPTIRQVLGTLPGHDQVD